MRKLFKLLLIAVLFFALATPVYAANVNFTIDVYRDEGFRTTTGGYGTAIATGITYQVLDDDTNTASTIYSDDGVTSKTNPVTTTVFATDGNIDFYISGTSATTVDIIVVDTAGGYTLYLDDVTISTTHCVIDERPGMMHHGMIWWDATTTVDGTDTDTGIDFDIGTLLHKIMIELINPASTSQLLCIGVQTGDTSGDHDGFINDMILSIDSGWIDPMRVGISSAGTDAFYINAVAGTPIGVLLGWIEEGTTSSANIDNGIVEFWPYLVNSNGQSLSYSISSGTGDTTGGYIHYFFQRLKWLDRSPQIYP